MNSSTRGGADGGFKKGVFALKWNSFTDHISRGLGELYQDDVFADVTLACEDQFIKAHKLVLSMCSPFFKKLFEANNDKNANTIVILNQVKFQDLEKIKTFIYQGKVNIAQSDLNRFLECAELLQIKGLSSFSSKRQKIEAAANMNSSENFPHGNPSSSNSNNTSTIATTTRTRNMPLRQNKQVTRSSTSTSMKDLMNNFMKQQQQENDDMMSRMMNSDSLPYEMDEMDPLVDDGFEPSNEDPLTSINNSNMVKEEGAGSSNNQQDFINLEDYLEEEYEDEYNTTEENNYQMAEDIEDGEITGTGPVANAIGQRARGTLKSRKRSRAKPKPKSKLVKSGKLYRNCPYCQTQIYKSNLSRHIATIHTQILLEKGEKLFRCNICKQLYRNVGHLKLHMEKNHFGETFPQE